jgi:hypothetical protein
MWRGTGRILNDWDEGAHGPPIADRLVAQADPTTAQDGLPIATERETTNLAVDPVRGRFAFSGPVFEGVNREIAFESGYREVETRRIAWSLPKALRLLDYRRLREGLPGKIVVSCSAAIGSPARAGDAGYLREVDHVVGPRGGLGRHDDPPSLGFTRPRTEHLAHPTIRPGGRNPPPFRQCRSGNPGSRTIPGFQAVVRAREAGAHSPPTGPIRAASSGSRISTRPRRKPRHGRGSPGPARPRPSSPGG